MTGDEAAALIEGFDRERWYAEGTRVMRKDECCACGEEIVDVDGFRGEECDPGVARIMAAGPRALLAVVELTRERDDALAALERANDALVAQRETARRFVAAVHHAGECVLAAVTSYEDDSRG